MNTIEKLDKEVSDILVSRKAFIEHFTKKDINTYIDYLINNHKLIVDVLSSIDSKNKKKLAKEIGNTRNAERMGFKAYVEFVNMLKGKAKRMESGEALSSLQTVSEEYITILNEILKNVNKLFSSEKMNIFNMKVSHVAIVGVLYQAEKLAIFTKYMISAISLAKTGYIGNLAPYRLKYLYDNSTEVAGYVVAMIDKEGASDIFSIVENIKINASDFTLVSEDNSSQIKQINKSIIKRGTSMVLDDGTKGLLGMASIGRMCVLFKHWLNQLRLSETEWMKSHIAILLLELEETPEDDPKYEKLQKIIQRYEDLINKYERKRNEVR